jgi:hypothetical protein
MRSQEPESRSQERRWVGRTTEGSRFNASSRPGGILPYHGLRLGKVKAGGSRELPSAMF